jgi:hypothetical protein
MATAATRLRHNPYYGENRLLAVTLGERPSRPELLARSSTQKQAHGERNALPLCAHSGPLATQFSKTDDAKLFGAYFSRNFSAIRKRLRAAGIEGCPIVLRGQRGAFDAVRGGGLPRRTVELGSVYERSRQVRIWSFRHGALFMCGATILAGCSGSQPPEAIPPSAVASARTAHISAPRGWMSPDRKKAKTLLYASGVITTGLGFVDVFSVPKYSLVGQITDGINWPEGLAVDKNGDLYVTNLFSNTVTIYQPGGTSPSLTLTVPNEPADVAVGSNGYVYVAEGYADGIDVYPPGATSPSRRLTNPDLDYGVGGVAVSSSNDVYADGSASFSGPPPSWNSPMRGARAGISASRAS